MAESKKRERVDIDSLVPVWIHEKGVKGYDQAGKPVASLEPNSYGYVTRLVKGTQPASTSALDLKSYVKKRTYKTRQIKAEESS